MVATFVAQTVAYGLPALGLPRLDLPMLNGNLMVPDTTAVSFAWTVGSLQTLALGALLAGIHGRWIRPRMPGGPSTAALLWGLVLAVVAGLTAFPLLFGAGLFGAGWAPAMPVVLVMWFLTWGLTLGAVSER